MKSPFVLFAKLFIKPILELFIERIEGLGKIPKDTNFILAPNHESYFDHLFVPYLVKDRLRKIHFIGKMENLWNWVQWAWFYWLTETLPLNRKATTQEKRKVLKKALDFLKKGDIIIIYPEGTRNKRKVLLKGKIGVAELALKSKLPVVPVGIIYKGEIKKGNKKIVLKVGQPLVFAKENQPNLREITNKIMREISKLTNKDYPY